jgi:hypothetical protein
MHSRPLIRLILVMAVVAISLALAGGGLAQEKQGTETARMAPTAPQTVPVVITSQGRPMREDALPAATRAQVERVRKAAEGLANPAGTSERIKVTVECSYPPLKCTITIQF